jgi:RimJ/RimL family protein N-acetyltransferase
MIETSRFLLKELQKEHATSQYLGWLKSSAGNYLTNTQDDIDSLIRYIENYQKNTSAYLMGIFCKDSKNHIGNVKFEYLNDEKSLVEMGILIGEPAFHGKGVAIEVISAFASYTVNEYGTELMVLGVSKYNTQAISAYRKLGFKPENRPLSNIDSDDGMLMSWELNNE